MAEIRLSPVEVGSLSVYPVFFVFGGFIYPRWLFGISEPSTVVQLRWLETRKLDVCILYNYLGCFGSLKEGLYLNFGEAAAFQFSQQLLLAQDTLSGLWQDVLIVCLAKHLQGHTGTAECGEIKKLSKCFLKKGLQMETITISEIFF